MSTHDLILPEHFVGSSTLLSYLLRDYSLAQISYFKKYVTYACLTAKSLKAGLSSMLASFIVTIEDLFMRDRVA